MSYPTQRSRYEIFDYLLNNRVSKEKEEEEEDELPELEDVASEKDESENESENADELSENEDLRYGRMSSAFEDGFQEFYREPLQDRDPLPETAAVSLYEKESEQVIEPRLHRRSCTQLIEFLASFPSSTQNHVSWISHSSLRGSQTRIPSLEKTKPLSIQVVAKTPLSLADEIYSKNKKEVVLICFCDPEMPGGSWFQAGPHTDDDEVDLLASSDVYKQLQSHVTENMLPLKPDSCILVKNGSVFRSGEGAKLRPDNWSKVHVFFVPYVAKLTSKPLTEQFKFILKCLSHYQMQHSEVVFPLNRWCRNDLSSAEIGTRLSQALESTDFQGTLHVTCPPNMKLWHQSLISVMGSFQVRQAEQKPKEEIKPIVKETKPKEELKPIVKPKEELKPIVKETKPKEELVKPSKNTGLAKKTKHKKKSFSSKESSKERLKKP